jgi:hypothetical protein
LSGRIGAQRSVRAARGEGCLFSILSCLFVVRCAVAAQGEKRSRLGGDVSIFQYRDIIRPVRPADVDGSMGTDSPPALKRSTIEELGLVRGHWRSCPAPGRIICLPTDFQGEQLPLNVTWSNPCLYPPSALTQFVPLCLIGGKLTMHQRVLLKSTGKPLFK